VYLPVVKSRSVKKDICEKKPIPGGTESVLLVDDENSIVSMEKQVLERLGYQVTSCTNSVEALKAFRTSPDKFDLVITDKAMPEMSGDKLAAELIKIRHDIPILLCTGFSESMSEEMAASLGVNGFILKPVITQDLAKKIREILDGNKNV
jgi:CheY-like chemotaxis protein